MNKKVSVIIPTYKRSEFLERAIESALNQTYTNIEIIIVDDNDPNSSFRIDTEKKMEKYQANTKIRYIKNKSNLGGALARNEGIFKATGDFITFLDDDDIYLPEKIAIQVKFMVDNKLDLSFTDVIFHNSDSILVDYREHYYIKQLANEELLKQHILHHLTPTATYMFKTEKVKKIGGFDDVQMGQEFMLMLKAIESGFNIGYLASAHVIQYLHDGERISVGQKKLEKEVELYNFKKKYFKVLNIRQRRYVKFRHHAVMTIVGLRSKKFKLTMKHLLKAISASPQDCFLEVINHIKKINKYKNLK